MAEGKRNCSDSPEHEQSKKIKNIGPLEAPPDGEITDLPEEIIVQILKILPVKSLLRFRCVCKSWLSLISSSEFIKTHLNYSINDANLINHRIMFTILNPKDNYLLKHCSAYSVMFEPLTVASDIDYPRRNQHRSVRMVGYCNGLICFTIMSKQDIYLWNPSTRTSKKLPHPAVKLKRPFYCMYGFGYNESDDDYKVVSIYCDFRNVAVYKSPVKIYSLRTNSWKRIGDFDGGDSLVHYGKFASGKLHFIAELKIDSNCELAILSLDLKSEVYGKVELPNFEEGYFVTETYFGVLGGCICLTLNYPQIRADVWVLKEYDVEESWTKLVSIPYVDPFVFHLHHVIGFYLNPVLMLPSGEILLVFAERLVIYNPKDNSFRLPRTSSNIDCFRKADIYVESLISL